MVGDRLVVLVKEVRSFLDTDGDFGILTSPRRDHPNTIRYWVEGPVSVEIGAVIVLEETDTPMRGSELTYHRVVEEEEDHAGT